METNRDELTRIKAVLKQNPKGMNVIEIARAIDMHRQSVTKYVEMLVVSGQVEMKAFGPSKVYYLSQRLPLSAMLSLSSDLILLLDRDLKVINVNDAFLSFVGVAREDILNKQISLVSLPLAFDPPIKPYVVDALNGKESRIDALFKKDGRERFFNIKLIPVVFDDGRPGATAVFEDVTGRKRAEEGLANANRQLELYLDLLKHDVSNMHQIALARLEIALEVMAEKGRLEGEDAGMIRTSIDALLRSDRLISDVHKLQESGAGRGTAADLGRMIAGGRENGP